jgi:hypothetical protein
MGPQCAHGAHGDSRGLVVTNLSAGRRNGSRFNRRERAQRSAEPLVGQRLAIQFTLI